MSDQDRQLWNTRYKEGSYSSRPYPSPMLVHWHERLKLSTQLDVLDVGCGAGRNSLYLAEQGHRVTGVDISEQALARARQSASERNLAIQFESMDFDLHTPATGAWDLVVMMRFMNRTVQPKLASLLKPGGLLLMEHHVVTDKSVRGPQPPNDDSFRLRPNEIINDCDGLHVIFYSEHQQIDTDDSSVVLAQLVASNESVQPFYDRAAKV